MAFHFFQPLATIQPKVFFFCPSMVIILPLVFSFSHLCLLFSPRFSPFPILGYYSAVGFPLLPTLGYYPALGLYSAGESRLVTVYLIFFFYLNRLTCGHRQLGFTFYDIGLFNIFIRNDWLYFWETHIKFGFEPITKQFKSLNKSRKSTIIVSLAIL